MPCLHNLKYVLKATSKQTSTRQIFPHKIILRWLTVLCETKRNETKWYFAKRYFAKWYFAKRYFAKWYFAKRYLVVNFSRVVSTQRHDCIQSVPIEPAYMMKKPYGPRVSSSWNSWKDEDYQALIDIFLRKRSNLENG